MESQGWPKVVAFPWVCVLDGLQACYTWDSAPMTRWTRWKHQTCVKNLLWPEGLLGKTAVASKRRPPLHGPLGPPDHRQHLQQSYSLNMWGSQQRAEVWIRVCWSHHLMIPWCPHWLPVQWGPNCLLKWARNCNISKGRPLWPLFWFISGAVKKTLWEKQPGGGRFISSQLHGWGIPVAGAWSTRFYSIRSEESGNCTSVLKSYFLPLYSSTSPT